MASKTTTIQELTEEQKQARLQELEKNLQDLVNRLQDPNSDINDIIEADDPKRRFYMRWAETLEEKYVLLGNQEKIGYISNEIRKTLKSVGFEKRIPYMYEVLDSRFKTHDPNPGFEETSDNPTENASSITEDESILLEALAAFKEYHRKFIEIAERYESHITNPEIHKDFASVLEWKSIASFCQALQDLAGPMSLLQQMLDEGNIRQSATIFQKAMSVIFLADTSYRQWAHMFGVSPRQNQRIRQRLEEWPEKDAETVIRNVIGSFCCPCGCKFNLITKKHINEDGKEFTGKIKKLILQYKSILKKENENVHLSSNDYDLPEEYQNTGMNPIEIAAEIWRGRLKPISN